MAKPVNDEMRRFWDERAREDAFYFVDNRLRYRRPDQERFWEGGQEDLDRMLDLLGARIDPRDRIVEIGCGLGRITRALAKRGRDVRALDVSAEMLEMASAYNPTSRTSSGSPATGARWRRSRPRAQTPVNHRLHRPHRLAERMRMFVLSRIGRAPRGQSHPAWLGSSIDLGRLERAAAEAGMEIERVTGEGTQMCLVLLRKGPTQAPPERG